MLFLLTCLCFLSHFMNKESELHSIPIVNVVYFQIQFQLNRLPVCEMHYGVDKLPSLSLVFPDLTAPPSIPWTPDR